MRFAVSCLKTNPFHSQCEIEIQASSSDEKPASQQANTKDAPSTNGPAIIVSSAIVAAVGCLIIIITVIVTGKKQAKPERISITPDGSSEDESGEEGEKDDDPREII